MPITREEVGEAAHQYCAAFDSRDFETIVAMQRRAVGFGWRVASWREREHRARGEGGHWQRLERFFGQMESYRAWLEEVETSVAGDVGLAWGVQIEEFQERGRPPERARARFSMTLTRGASGWEVLLFHRDIQPFDEEGRYPRALTAISPDSQVA